MIAAIGNPDAATRQSRGAAARNHRQNHYLRYRSGIATPAQVDATEHALVALLRMLSATGAADKQLARGGAAVRLLIDLGRNAAKLAALSHSHLANLSDAVPPWGLVSWEVKGELKYGWWLPAGVHIDPDLGERNDKVRGAIWLPVLERTKPWMILLGWLDDRSARPLLVSNPDDLKADIAKFFAWAKRTLGPLGRSLPRADRLAGVLAELMAWQPTGDRILANQVAGRDMPRSNARSYYTSFPTRKAAKRYRKSVRAPISTLSLAHPESDAIAMPPFAEAVFTRRNPRSSINAVRAILTLQPERLDRRRDLIAEHEALVLRIWFALAIATAARGVTQWVPGVRRIEPRTGALIVLDKDRPTDGEPVQLTGKIFGAPLGKARIVFLPPKVRAMLAGYHAHLVKLAARTELASKSRVLIERHIATLEAGDLVPFLGLARHSDGRQLTAHELQPSWITKRLAGLEELKHDFARHILRSGLAGDVPQSVIDALLGHFDFGTEPWANGSAFDPAAYRAMLNAIFEARFSDVVDFSNPGTSYYA